MSAPTPRIIALIPCLPLKCRRPQRLASTWKLGTFERPCQFRQSGASALDWYPCRGARQRLSAETIPGRRRADLLCPRWCSRRARSREVSRCEARIEEFRLLAAFHANDSGSRRCPPSPRSLSADRGRTHASASGALRSPTRIRSTSQTRTGRGGWTTSAAYLFAGEAPRSPPARAGESRSPAERRWTRHYSELHSDARTNDRDRSRGNKSTSTGTCSVRLATKGTASGSSEVHCGQERTGWRADKAARNREVNQQGARFSGKRRKLIEFGARSNDSRFPVHGQRQRSHPRRGRRTAGNNDGGKRCVSRASNAAASGRPFRSL
jgi:hypothetical protein